VANFVGKMGVASGDIPESYMFAKGYHHLQTFSCELEKNSQFANIFLPLYGTCRLEDEVIVQGTV